MSAEPSVYVFSFSRADTSDDINHNSLHDMLIYYNVLDCVPFVQAVQNLLQPYLEQGLDFFKTLFSVSGVDKLQMMKKNLKKCMLLSLP